MMRMWPVLGLSFCGMTAVAAPDAAPPAWRFHGAARAAVSLVDSTSKSRASFAASDVFLAFGMRTAKYTVLAEAEAGAGGSSDADVLRLRQARVGYEPSEGVVGVQIGRQILKGASRVGTDAVTRRNDEAFGRIEGARLEVGGGARPYTMGVVAGNTLGLHGASSDMAEHALTVDVTDPSRAGTPKKARASAAYLEGCLGGFCAEGWYGLEKDHFTKAPSGQATTDGVVYERLQHAEGGLRYDAAKFVGGAWYRKVWLKNPTSAGVGPNGDIVKGEGPAGSSNWTEVIGVGAEYAALGRAATAPAGPIAGLSYVQSRRNTEGLEKGSVAAEAEDAKDLKQYGLSLGWREAPATISLSVLQNQAKGEAFPAKDGGSGGSKKRTVVYSAFGVAL